MTFGALVQRLILTSVHTTAGVFTTVSILKMSPFGVTPVCMGLVLYKNGPDQNGTKFVTAIRNVQNSQISWTKRKTAKSNASVRAEVVVLFAIDVVNRPSMAIMFQILIYIL